MDKVPVKNSIKRNNFIIIIILMIGVWLAIYGALQNDRANMLLGVGLLIFCLIIDEKVQKLQK